MAQWKARQVTLEHLISDMHEFIADWTQRLEGEAKSWQADFPSNPVSQAQLDDFEQQKRQWETTRTQEKQLILEQSEQLTAAWLQLEAEQRRFLQLQQERDIPSACGPAQSQLSLQPESIMPTTRSRDAAVRQFHQLRQEVGAQQHRM